MKVKKDSIINPFCDLNNGDLLGKLEDDTSFWHFANIKIGQNENYKGRKIFFNQYNGFYWRRKSFYTGADSTIGALQQGIWYKFRELGLIGNPYVFIYIDSANVAHRFDVDLSVW
jgi:hypothetical protein